MPSYPQSSLAPEYLPELLRPAIEKYRDEAQEGRRLPAELLDHLRANGAFRLNTPRELGGFELPLATTTALIERLARIDGPTAWIVWNLNAGFTAAFLDEASVDRIWADGPDPMIAHSSQPGFLVPSDDGFRLSGEWKLVSGADSAQWLGLLGIVLDGGQPRMTETGPDWRFCLVPRSAVTVRDTWHTTGMRGTNSNTVIAQDVQVAADMMVASDTKARIDRQLFRLPLTNQITSGGAAVVLGIARAAIDEMAELTRTKLGPDGMPIAQQPRIQAAFGRAGAQVDAASALLLSKLGRLDAAAASGRPATEAERGAVRGAYSHAGETARAVLTSMYELGGSTALYESSRLGTLFHDGHAAAQHAILSAANYEPAGRTVIGIPSGDPTL
ncbi:acyl-CoA dehydrogenase family protein [Streptomyces brasiliensis]|uniref:Acyl-CoA dehydrogenase n=1 Tax=Streptomyces brasiliensis TaxID=1954 RepID=A0A917KWX9_9ACTN|nr:acyl-CoA dehydrogenase family protein [Streptomyces brasiliensis]GGJ33882.1 acyl-CoA dehydrogenase [Streptomyces brasiliensis]